MKVKAGGGPISAQDLAELKARLGLSPRQAEIVNHIFNKKADKQIANDMGISIATIRTHMSRLFHKFGANDRVELILFFATALRECDKERAT